jgi:hypothetical protein
LLTFDQIVLSIAITQLERIKESQDTGKITNPRHRVDGVITMIKRIRENDSLAPYFDAINNQCLVLLVSYFAAALRDLYRAAVGAALETTPSQELLSEELKVSVGELLRTQDDPASQIANLLIDKKDLSFQDMQGTARAFEELTGFNPPKDSTVHDIIVAQACRHAIVHAGEIASTRTLGQLASAVPRSIKSQLKVGERIVFVVEEVKAVAQAMDTYVVRLIDGITTGAA